MTQEGKARRPKGTGSVYGRDGVVIGRYEVRTPDGGIRRRYVRGKDKKEVAGRLTKAIADRDSGLTYDSGKTPVGEYLDGWLDAIWGDAQGEDAAAARRDSPHPREARPGQDPPGWAERPPGPVPLPITREIA